MKHSRNCRHRGTERLESRCLLSATAFEHDNIGYLLRPDSSAIERYDIAAEKWLSPIQLEGAIGAPTVGMVDDDGIYAAFGQATYRYNLDGTGQTHLINMPGDVSAIHSDGNLLFLNAGVVASIDKTTNTVIDTLSPYIDTVIGSSIAPGINRIFGTEHYSPSDVTFASYDDSGHFTANGDSPYHGSYGAGDQTWVFDHGTKVIDSSGNVFAAQSLLHLGSAGGYFTDVAFVGDEIPIILNYHTISAYNAGLVLTGSKFVNNAPSKLFVNDSDVIAFTADAQAPHGYLTDFLSLASLHAAKPGEGIDPRGLPFTPDNSVLANDGTVLLLSKANESIFRWDPQSQSFGKTISLSDVPDYMTYAAKTNTIYLAYSSGAIHKIDLNNPDWKEEAFTQLQGNISGIAAAGTYLFVAQGSVHSTFDPTGVLVSSMYAGYYSLEYVWSDATQKMYYFRDGVSPNDLLWEQINADGKTYPSLAPGGIGYSIDSPLHDSSGFIHPIRVAPDGSIVVLGSGVIHDATTLARQLGVLALDTGTGTNGGSIFFGYNYFKDFAWLQDTIYSVRQTSYATQYTPATSVFQKWSGPSHELTASTQVNGTPVALLAVSGSELVGITIGSDGIPIFTTLDPDLHVAPRPVPVARAGADVTTQPGQQVTLDGSASYDPDGGPSPLTYQWSIVSGPGTGTFDSPQDATTGFTPDASGEYEIQLTVSDGLFSTSDTVSVFAKINHTPVAVITPVQPTMLVGYSQQIFNASQSSDADGDYLTYQWDVTSSPAGSYATIYNQTDVAPYFYADAPGVYTVQLSVSDGTVQASEHINVRVISQTTTQTQHIIALGAAAGSDTGPAVKIIDADSGAPLSAFMAYESNFHGGVRVAVADLDGDGTPEVIAAPGAGRAATIKVFDINGQELTNDRINAYSAFTGGVHVAAADVNGDGLADLITTPGNGRAAEVRVWLNHANANPLHPFNTTADRRFLAFTRYTGGVTVAAGDVTGDGRAEIVVGTASPTRPYVRVFNLASFRQSSTLTLPPRLSEFAPFPSRTSGGDSVAVGDVFGDGRPEIIVGGSMGGDGRINVFSAGGRLMQTIAAFSDSNPKAPITVAVKALSADSTAHIIASQIPPGSSLHWRVWDSSGGLVDDVFESDFDFRHGFSIA